MLTSADFMNNSGSWIIHELRLLQRQGRDPRSCSELPQVGYNEADAVRSARPEGKKYRWIL